MKIIKNKEEYYRPKKMEVSLGAIDMLWLSLPKAIERRDINLCGDIIRSIEILSGA